MKKKFLTSLSISLFIVLQIWCSYITFHSPYIGIYLERSPQQQWIIQELSAEGAASKLNLKVGDVVTEIDGLPPEQSSFVQRWRTIEQSHSLTILRNGTERLELNLDASSDKPYDFAPVLEEAVCVFVGVLLLVKMRHSKSAKLLAAVFMNMAVIYMSMGASVRGDAVGKLTIASLMVLLPVVFYHFLVVFFQEKGQVALPSKVIKYLYLIAGVSFAFRCLYLIPSVAYTAYQFHDSGTLSLFVLGFLFNMSVLTYVYFKVRKQKSYITSIIKSVWLSWMISFLPVICFSFLPKILWKLQILDGVFTSWIILLFPISFAYLVASSQLYDFGLVIRRVLFAGLIAVVPVSLFTGGYVALFHGSVNEKHIFFIFGGSLMVMVGVLYAAEYWTTRLESFLFPRKYALQFALKKISRNLGTISSFRELKEIILTDIVDTLQVKGGAIVFRYKDEPEIIHVGDVEETVLEMISRTPAGIPEIPKHTVIEMYSNEDYKSYLIITPRKTNTRLGKEEIQWLHLITSYLEISLENVHLIRKLTSQLQHMSSYLPQEDVAKEIQWFRKVMFELQEEERVRIANDLHDTTMQDLFFLKRRLAALGEKSNLTESNQDQLNTIIQFVEMVNAGLRQSCFELNPHLIKEIGLMKTLSMYLQKEAYTAPFQLEFTEEKTYTIETKDLLTKRHIFRIVQELLNNAKKHSQATRVTFTAMEMNGSFHMLYEDNGVGFDDKAERPRQIGGSGQGLEQIRSRIQYMGGSIEFISQGRKGTKAKLVIPLEAVIPA